MRNTLQFYILVVLALVVIGCDQEESSSEASPSMAVAGHEGHDHGSSETESSEATADSLPTLDWCAEHAVPESACTRCNPTLIAGHKETGDWCVGHDLPESHCRLCNPEITFPQEQVLRSRSIELSANEIGVSLNFRSNATVCATDRALIQFASTATADRAGISTQTVRTGQLEIIDEAPAEILFDETKTIALTTTVDALVKKWLVSPGDEIDRGEVLAILQSPDMAQLRSDLLQAHAGYEVELKELNRHIELKGKGLISDSELDKQAALTEEHRAEYVEVRSSLLSAGQTDKDINDVLEFGNISNQFALRAPGRGVIIERLAQLGELLVAGRALATTGDPSALWIEAQLTEEQLRGIDAGHQVTFSSDGRGLNQVGGEIIWISRFLDSHTRTGTVRARVLNPDHTLRAGEFGRVRLVGKERDEVALVPRDAVQWEGCCNVVFVRESIDRYRPHKVELVEGDGPFYQVSGGVQAGEDVVVDGAFLLKTELKKSSIGAGCCGLEPVG